MFLFLKTGMWARPLAFMNIETVGHLIKYGQLLFILFFVVLYVSCSDERYIATGYLIAAIEK
jgi:hypothetical protein